MARLTNDRRLPAATFDPVREDHIWLAVQSIVSGRVQHSFGESTDYDVIADDQSRLPPKAVFGVAASEALGIDIRPWHFTGGLNTRCFEAINDAGYRIVPKGEAVGADELPVIQKNAYGPKGTKSSLRTFVVNGVQEFHEQKSGRSSANMAGCFANDAS